MIGRLLKPLKQKSFFLFGARGTGKSTLLGELYRDASPLCFDLLDPVLLDDLRLDRERFKRIINAPENKGRLVVIDEAQRLPDLLNYVHQSIFSERNYSAQTAQIA